MTFVDKFSCFDLCRYVVYGEARNNFSLVVGDYGDEEKHGICKVTDNF